MNEEETFLDLSRVLTGRSELDAALSRAYLGRLERTFDAASVAAVLARFTEIQSSDGDVIAGVRDRLFGDPQLAGLVKTTLLLWYTGGIRTAGLSGRWEMDAAEQFFGALVWEDIGAHAPGTSTGFFGHWRYEPERGAR